jgi:hypothetical protein
VVTGGSRSGVTVVGEMTEDVLFKCEMRKKWVYNSRWKKRNDCSSRLETCKHKSRWEMCNEHNSRLDTCNKHKSRWEMCNEHNSRLETCNKHKSR